VAIKLIVHPRGEAIAEHILGAHVGDHALDLVRTEA
jgi:hypothetical protein